MSTKTNTKTRQYGKPPVTLPMSQVNVLRWLRDQGNPPALPREIATGVGQPLDSVRTYLSSFFRHKLVDRKKTGRHYLYTVSDEGITFLDRMDSSEEEDQVQKEDQFQEEDQFHAEDQAHADLFLDFMRLTFKNMSLQQEKQNLEGEVERLRTAYESMLKIVGANALIDMTRGIEGVIEHPGL